MEVEFSDFDNHGDPTEYWKSVRQLSRTDRGILNRLRSIASDAKFVHDATARLPYTVVANLRCGLWYAPGADACCYFKSTDGHNKIKNFAPGRLNLHLVDKLVESGGCVIVDSTRKGKPFPDALTRTIPIWCAVVNSVAGRALPLEETLPRGTPGTEVQRLLREFPSYVEEFLKVAPPGSGDRLRSIVKKPLRPQWQSRGGGRAAVSLSSLKGTTCSELGAVDADAHEDDGGDATVCAADCYPVVCLSASTTAKTPQPETFHDALSACGYVYVQGAADDEESWSCGLTPALFERHKEELLRSAQTDAECARLARELVSLAESTPSDGSDACGRLQSSPSGPNRLRSRRRTRVQCNVDSYSGLPAPTVAAAPPSADYQAGTTDVVSVIDVDGDGDDDGDDEENNTLEASGAGLPRRHIRLGLQLLKRPPTRGYYGTALTKCLRHLSQLGVGPAELLHRGAKKEDDGQPGEEERCGTSGSQEVVAVRAHCPELLCFVCAALALFLRHPLASRLERPALRSGICLFERDGRSMPAFLSRQLMLYFNGSPVGRLQQRRPPDSGDSPLDPSSSSMMMMMMMKKAGGGRPNHDPQIADVFVLPAAADPHAAGRTPEEGAAESMGE
eukprot:GHVU01231532.1.p1 GENE.GHVU01231532.1~~GHVU01231532.1.p1  ORF type:complete len:619 (-),score=128.59 GHVU01231532.1:177-2033(-)